MRRVSSEIPGYAKIPIFNLDLDLDFGQVKIRPSRHVPSLIKYSTALLSRSIGTFFILPSYFV